MKWFVNKQNDADHLGFDQSHSTSQKADRPTGSNNIISNTGILAPAASTENKTQRGKKCKIVNRQTWRDCLRSFVKYRTRESAAVQEVFTYEFAFF